MRKNRLRELLDAGLPSLGTHLMSTWPTVTELVGQTGQFDYIEFVAEYAPWTMHDLDNLGRAIELFTDFSGMVKIEQDARGHLAMRAIGSGLQNVLFADVRTVEDAILCVRSVRAEHPEHLGRHGAGLRRDSRSIAPHRDDRVGGDIGVFGSRTDDRKTRGFGKPRRHLGCPRRGHGAFWAGRLCDEHGPGVTEGRRRDQRGRGACHRHSSAPRRCAESGTG